MDDLNNDPQDDQNKSADPQHQNGQPDNVDQIDPDDVEHQQSKPPSVTGEEDVSGDMPAESPDLDEELEKIGKVIDPEHPKPLGEE